MSIPITAISELVEEIDTGKMHGVTNIRKRLASLAQGAVKKPQISKMDQVRLDKCERVMRTIVMEAESTLDVAKSVIHSIEGGDVNGAKLDIKMMLDPIYINDDGEVMASVQVLPNKEMNAVLQKVLEL